MPNSHRGRSTSPRNRSLTAERTRGAVMSHRDWLTADRARTELRQQWSNLFREWDVVLCPTVPTPAFSHDHSSPIKLRHIRIMANHTPTSTHKWCGRNSPRLPASRRRWRLSIAQTPVCRSGYRSSDLISKIAPRSDLPNFSSGVRRFRAAARLHGIFPVTRPNVLKGGRAVVIRPTDFGPALPTAPTNTMPFSRGDMQRLAMAHRALGGGSCGRGGQRDRRNGGLKLQVNSYERS